MRLTNEFKNKLARNVAIETTQKEKDKLKKQEHKLALLCYKSVYSKKERDMAKAMPEGWLRMDRCLRFNVGGQYFNCNPLEPLPVKYSSGCASLGVITDKEIIEKVAAYKENMEAYKMNFDKIERVVYSTIRNISTYKVLEKTWVEGKKFYEKYAPKKEDSQLPAIQIEEVNKLLGLK
jgi:hypothetical protein